MIAVAVAESEGRYRYHYATAGLCCICMHTGHRYTVGGNGMDGVGLDVGTIISITVLSLSRLRVHEPWIGFGFGSSSNVSNRGHMTAASTIAASQFASQGHAKGSGNDNPDTVSENDY